MVVWYLPPLFPSWLSYRYPPALRIQYLCASIISGIHQNPQCPQQRQFKPSTEDTPTFRPYSIYSLPDKKSKLVRHVQTYTTKGSPNLDRQLCQPGFGLDSGSAAPPVRRRARLTRKANHHVCLWPTIPTWHSNLLPTPWVHALALAWLSRTLHPFVFLVALRKRVHVAQTFFVSGELQ